jgi:hypothetical protein
MVAANAETPDGDFDCRPACQSEGDRWPAAQRKEAPQGLVFLTAGAVNTTVRYNVPGSQGGVVPDEQGVSTAGSRIANINYTMDGAGHNDTYINSNLPFPNPDAVQEFSVQTANISAEYGGSSVVVNIATIWNQPATRRRV